MKDRIPSEGKAGRVLITPENGSTPFYATVTMADEPVDEGTPLNTGDIVFTTPNPHPCCETERTTRDWKPPELIPHKETNLWN